MNNDLVARLRTITVADSANIIYKTMAEAANEIERLRADRDKWREFANDTEQTLKNCISSNEEVGYIMQAAVRNYWNTHASKPGDKQ